MPKQLPILEEAKIELIQLYQSLKIRKQEEVKNIFITHNKLFYFKTGRKYNRINAFK